MQSRLPAQSAHSQRSLLRSPVPREALPAHPPPLSAAGLGSDFTVCALVPLCSRVWWQRRTSLTGLSGGPGVCALHSDPVPFEAPRLHHRRLP